MGRIFSKMGVQHTVHRRTKVSHGSKRFWGERLKDSLPGGQEIIQRRKVGID